MFAKLAIYAVMIFVAVLAQVSFIALPFALIIIIFWHSFFGFRNIEFLLLLFAILLSSLTNTSFSLVFLISILSISCFLVLKKYLPSRGSFSFLAVVFSLVFWQASLAIFSLIWPV